MLSIVTAVHEVLNKQTDYRCIVTFTCCEYSLSFFSTEICRRYTLMFLKTSEGSGFWPELNVHKNGFKIQFFCAMTLHQGNFVVSLSGLKCTQCKVIPEKWNSELHQCKNLKTGKVCLVLRILQWCLVAL